MKGGINMELSLLEMEAIKGRIADQFTGSPGIARASDWRRLLRVKVNGKTYQIKDAQIGDLAICRLDFEIEVVDEGKQCPTCGMHYPSSYKHECKATTGSSLPR